MTTVTHLLQQHQAEVMAGHAIDPAWNLDVENCVEVLFDASECERLAACAPTDYLAGFWLGRALGLREFQILTQRSKKWQSQHVDP